ncbi:hypothetical protein VTI28DRAFT_4178 [Corynascus sepedonium]
MAAAGQIEPVIEVANRPPSPKRPSRTLKPSAKAREAIQLLEDATDTARRTTTSARRTIEVRRTRTLGTTDGTDSQTGSGKGALQTLLDALSEQRDVITNQQNVICELRDAISKQQTMIQDFHHQFQEHQRQQSPRASYADIARTPPSSRPSGLRSVSSPHTTPSTLTDTPFCTIDTSRVEETEKNKSRENQEGWRYAAVVKEARNPDRIKVICKDEGEATLIKEAAQKINIPGLRVMRDQLYPVRVDNANRIPVLDTDGNVLPGAAETLGKENGVNIAKIAWLSRKDSGKAYGSMVVYVTKGSDARRLLDGHYFHLAGESAYTAVFARREGLIQCYNYQEIGHKAFACKKPQICGRGPHESFSRNCRVRSDIEAEQILVPSADITVALIRLPDQVVLVVSIYIEGGSDEALETATRELDRLIRRFRNGTGTRTDVIVAGDFNRHGQL